VVKGVAVCKLLQVQVIIVFLWLHKQPLRSVYLKYTLHTAVDKWLGSTGHYQNFICDAEHMDMIHSLQHSVVAQVVLLRFQKVKTESIIQTTSAK
jgi:hypothetical protein